MALLLLSWHVRACSATFACISQSQGQMRSVDVTGKALALKFAKNANMAKFQKWPFFWGRLPSFYTELRREGRKMAKMGGKKCKKNARVANFLRRFTRRVFFCFKEGFEGVWFFFACWICGFGACAAKKTPFSSGFFGTFCRQLALRKVWSRVLH